MNTENKDWREEWRNIKGTVITLPQKIAGDLVIDYDAMQKRDIDFIEQTLAEEREKIEKAIKEILVEEINLARTEGSTSRLTSAYMRISEVFTKLKE